MTGALIVLALILSVYAFALWTRADAISMLDVAREDIRRVLGRGPATPPPGALFEMRGRRGATPAPPRRVPLHPEPATGPGRRPNEAAPCWICGQPNVRGHSHT